MCAIFGWLDPAAARSAADLDAMGDAMKHRGPDDHGTLVSAADGLALGHNRLSIIDLSPAGHQPMFNEDRSVALSFNGEIYNFRELRDELVGAGHSFTSRTDCEVVVHGYEEWGSRVVERLQGMFAFALWDEREKALVLARDPMGIKPLYYWRSPSGGFHFASEIKAFLALPGFEARINERSLRQFLETNFVYDLHETSLEGVRKLPAGHTLAVSAARLSPSSRLEPRSYYTPPAVQAWSGDEADADRRADRLYEVLDGVVAQHLNADVPVGLLLSGGLDSSLVAALAARRQPIRTISMGFADSTVDERPFARLVADHVGSRHEEVLIRPEELTADLEAAVWFVDDLFGDWGVISTKLLYQKCREAGVKVVLVGEGSDELFGGYPQYEWGTGDEDGGPGLIRRAVRLYQGYSGRRWGAGLPELLGTLRRLHRESAADGFSTVRLFECRHQLPHCYNMKVDKASMAASVEARVPFLDVRVAAEAFTTPHQLLLRDQTNKDILRRMAERRGLLPPEVTRRAKFGASIASAWMDSVPGFRSFARDVVLDPSGWAAPLGLRPAMEDYFTRDRAGYPFPCSIGIFSIVAWRLLLLNLWSRHYLRPRRAAA